MRCEKCKIDIEGNCKHCPLCNGDLSGEETPDVFPRIPLTIDNRLILRIMAFASVVAAIVCVIINISLHSHGWWSLFVVAGLACFWMAFVLLLKKRRNLFKAIMWLVALISVLAVIWDLIMGYRGWSVDFVIPIMCTAAMAAMALIARLQRLKINDYMVYLIIDSFFGILSLVFLLLGVVRVAIPSAICAATSAISLAALLIFEGKALRAEIHRRLHL